MSSLHTSLATIPNRYAFIDTIDHCASNSSHISLMLIDIVRFSDVTTSLGIKVGDRFLLEIANRIRFLFGHDVEIGRISGDVFGVVISGQKSHMQLREKFERLVEHFKTPMHYDDHAFIADFNVGVTSSSAQNFNLIAFVSRAEAALKQAKENKYENYFLLNGHEKPDTGRSLALKADLKRALQNDELELYFQPQVDLNTLKIIGAECLLRWNHPLDGILFPGPLIEAAESYNMMQELAYWTFERAFLSVAELNSRGIDIMMSVNISPTQLYDTKLISQLKYLSHCYDVDLKRIELELTEDIALTNSLMVKKQLSQLRALGVGISVDDFGKGYSNLAYIRDLDINALKIDKSFVLELGDNPINRAIIEAARIIGHAKNCDVIAEGVETLEQLHILREVGLTMGQGYLFSKAIPLTEFVELTNQDIIVGDSPLRKLMV
ncbi:putative bifunctional diguanylate cyclase/phosphodiesterase [Alteromonas sp. ASW11-130]|uniref:putative bifunctional diguanylate cyclase/phosphodiesterase n=1 Tax=Alteromonas sp. ASW11-130 TaxID=3015775 RepID=UPI00224273EF|nr:bifunctional diguanylate cyclase/phosphodiesterase [Alteromonas sp. ASW11-130]MCW8090653.1 bifunctional diguanylate cyclase/phosphodiesterase [Alteromonas sp. ASW11-130]